MPAPEAEAPAEIAENGKAQLVHEGAAVLEFPPDADRDVFYNPVQEFNRDLTIVAMRAWASLRSSKRRAPGPFSCLDALSASGLRAIRYAKEIPELGHVVANDFDPVAAAAIERNVARNGLADSGKVYVANADALYVLQRHAMLGERFDVVDLDPYGTAAPFLEAAVAGVSDGGLLCITCTDMMSLGGRQPAACFTKYGGVPVPQSPFLHETALRLVLQTVATIAARQRKAIQPLFSASIDYYVRLFVRVHERPAETRLLANQLGVAYACCGCAKVSVQPFGSVRGASLATSESPIPNETAPAAKQPEKPSRIAVHPFGSMAQPDRAAVAPCVGPPVTSPCPDCQEPFRVIGPLYLGPLHDAGFLDRLLELVGTDVDDPPGNVPVGGKSRAGLAWLATVARQELPDVPFYWKIQHTTRFLRCNTPPLTTIFSALLNHGYRVSLTHCQPACFKTDAPAPFVFDLFKQHDDAVRAAAKAPAAADAAKTALSPGARCRSRPRQFDVDFTAHPDAERLAKAGGGAVRRPARPPGWGPKARAGHNADVLPSDRPKVAPLTPRQRALQGCEYLPPLLKAQLSSANPHGELAGTKRPRA